MIATFCMAVLLMMIPVCSVLALHKSEPEQREISRQELGQW
jgi:hypothetical protein